MAKGDRLLIPVDAPYSNSLGIALIAFARLEWMAVYVVQKIGEKGHNPKTSPTYVNTVSKKTAGQIADDLVNGANGLTDPQLRTQVKLRADDFKALTRRRNDLMHANPGTSRNGEQRLFRNGGGMDS